MTQGTKPTHYLFVKKKKKDGSTAIKVGAGWVNEWGGISIQLNPCVVLSDRDDVYINLWENKELKATTKSSEVDPPPSSDDSDVPF